MEASTFAHDTNCSCLLTLFQEVLSFPRQIIDLLDRTASNVIRVTHPSTVDLPPLSDFICTTISRSCITLPGVLLLATVYLDRLSRKLPSTATGRPCTKHRVFLASLIVAYKYLNDVGMKNKAWSRISGFFSLSEVNMMERQFLELIGFDLKVSYEELHAVLHSLYLNEVKMPAILPEQAIISYDSPTSSLDDSHSSIGSVSPPALGYDDQTL